MKKVKAEILIPQQQARDRFASHVQSVAFQLTLSRRMIDCLRVIRDYGFPHLASSSDGETKRLEDENRSVVKRIHQGSRRTFITDNFVGFMRSLDNRGLVIWNSTDYGKRKRGERSLKLSRAGHLTCALLVEAGLMPPQAKGSRC